MAKKIEFNKQYKPEPYTLVLSTRSMKHQGQISCVDPSSIVYYPKMNGAGELSFTVYKEMNGIKEQLWDEIKNLKLVYIPEINDYFEIQFDINEGNDVEKRITGKTLCEAELSQVMLYNIEINTEADIVREDYVKTVFYDTKNTKGSLLHRILEKAPHYSIGHVDPSLAPLQRSFSIDGSSIHDFLVGNCAEQFNCLFVFDSVNRQINVYDLYTVCMNNNCTYFKEKGVHYRGTFNDVCPKCGSTNLYYYGNDTTIYVDKDNLSNEITFNTNVDSIKNTFKLVAGDDDMTAAVVNNNPNGSAYLYYFSEDAKADMSPELVNKINSYDSLYDSYTDQYEENTKNVYNSLDRILYLTSTMMPTHETADTNATKEAAKLTVANLSPTALQKVTTSTSVATVNSALKAYAKTFIHSGKYKVDVNTGTFTYKGKDSSGWYYGNWTGNFKVTSYSDDEDTATSATITVKIYDNYGDFLNQKIDKQIAKDNKETEDGSVYEVLKIKTLDSFKNALKLYCLNRLTSFYDAIQSCLDILVQVDQATEYAEYYEGIYVPYYNKLLACQEEIDKRQGEIDQEQINYEYHMDARKEIQDILNFKNYLGTTLYNEFCSFRREDTYQNDNYISDDLDNATIFDNANLFLETARKEIVTAGTPQHSITANLYNLMLMKEFQPIVDNFSLGNYIRVCVEDKVYRLRLTAYKIDFGNPTMLNTEFSDMTCTADGMNDIRSIISNAQQMATSYTYVSKQAEKGNEAGATLEDFRREGLDSALYKIKNSDTEEVVVDKHGITAKAYDDITEDYLSEQIKITHNVLAFTDDNWNTVRLAIGKTPYTLNGTRYEEYGVNADFVIAGKIIGGDIYSTNYSPNSGTHINLTNGDFSFAGGKLTYNNDKVTLKGDIETSSGKIGGFTIDSNKLYNGSIGGNSSIHLSTVDESGIIANNLRPDWRMVIGSKFGVTSNGSLYSSDLHATNANISGVINASSGTFNGIINATGGSFSGNITAKGTITGGTITGAIITGNSKITIGNIYHDDDDWYADRHALEITRGGISFGDMCEIKYKIITPTAGGGSFDVAALRCYTQEDGNANIYIGDNRCTKGIYLDSDNVYALGKVFSGGRPLIYSSNNTIFDLQRSYNGSDNEYMQVSTDNGVKGISWWQSDIKLKKNINDTSISNASDIINRISHRQFDWKSNNKHVSLGYVADELMEIIPEAVFEVSQENDETIKQIDGNKIIPYITKAFQEMSDKIKDLENKLSELQ